MEDGHQIPWLLLAPAQQGPSSKVAASVTLRSLLVLLHWWCTGDGGPLVCLDAASSCSSAHLIQSSLYDNLLACRFHLHTSHNSTPAIPSDPLKIRRATDLRDME